MLRAEQGKGLVPAHFRDVINEIGFELRQQSPWLFVDHRDVEFGGDGLSLGARAIVDPDAFDAADLAPGGQLIARPEPGSKDNKA